jgi:hypothetical protein
MAAAGMAIPEYRSGHAPHLKRSLVSCNHCHALPYPAVVDALPPIYAPPVSPIRLGLTARVVAAALALTFVTPLLVGAWLTPDASGVGTHRQLGWSPCATLVSGVPCISCGMTTSVAWFAHGNWAASFYLQPAGWLLSLLLLWGFWIAAYVAATGRPVHRLLAMLSMRWALLILSGAVLASWGWKVYLHSRGLDGW